MSVHKRMDAIREKRKYLEQKLLQCSGEVVTTWNELCPPGTAVHVSGRGPGTTGSIAYLRAKEGRIKSVPYVYVVLNGGNPALSAPILKSFCLEEVKVMTESDDESD